MKDQSFTVYVESGICLSGSIWCGCLQMTSEVYGGGYSSEKHYVFTKEETEKLFSICSLEEFIEICREGHCAGMEAFLKENGIPVGTVTI